MESFAHGAYRNPSVRREAISFQTLVYTVRRLLHGATLVKATIKFAGHWEREGRSEIAQSVATDG